MSSNEVERNFPRPSEQYDGEFLDPMLIEEDFVVVAGLAQRFARGSEGFTEDELMQHLAGNGVILYGTQADWDALFSDLKDRVVHDGAEKQPPVHVVWREQEVGKIALHSITVTVVSEAEPVLDTSQEDTGVWAPPKDPVSAVQALLAGASEVSRSALVVLAAQRLNVPLADARKLIDMAVTEGKLLVTITGGKTHISSPLQTQTPSSDSRPPEVVRKGLAATMSQEELLDELDLYRGVVRFVMSSLVALRHTTSGLAYDKMYERSGDLQEVVDFDSFKRFVRRMEEDGLVTIDRDARLHTKTGRSKVIRGSKVSIASPEVKLSWKVSPRKNLDELYARSLAALIDGDE